MGTGLRANKRGVTGSVGSLDLDVVSATSRRRGCCRRYRRGQACGYGKRHKVAPRNISGMRIVLRLVTLIVCHGFSCNEFIAFGYPTASSRPESHVKRK